MVVDVATGADLELGRPRVLFEETEMPAPNRWGEATYDVVLNWTEELERLVPTAQ